MPLMKIACQLTKLVCSEYARRMMKEECVC